MGRKPWAYAGFTFALGPAIETHYRADGPAAAIGPGVLLALLAAS